MRAFATARLFSCLQQESFEKEQGGPQSRTA